MKFTVSIPASIQDVPLSMFQDIQKIYEANPDAHDSEFVAMKMVSIVTKEPMEKLRGLRLQVFDAILEQVTNVLNQPTPFNRIIEVDGQTFGFIPKLEDITTGEYIDLEEYMGKVSDYHKAMSVMYRPITLRKGEKYLIEDYKPGENESIMKQASLSDTLGAMLFFCNLAKALSIATLRYIEKELQTTTTESEPSLVSDGDGTNPLTTSQAATLRDKIQSLDFQSIKPSQSLVLTRRNLTLNLGNVSAN